MLKNETPPTRNAHFHGQDEAKLEPSWAKLAEVGPKLGSCWHLEAILPSSRRHHAILDATWRQLGANMLKNGTPLERNGAISQSTGQGSAEWRGPLMLRRGQL